MTWIEARNLLFVFAAIFWIAFAYWVFKDARRRIEDPLLVGIATLIGIALPFVGPFVYMLFRPPEYLEDVRERKLEIQAIEERLAYDLSCPVCRSPVEASFLVCPICTTKLKQACINCKAPLEAVWQVCPFCETPVAPAAAAEIRSAG
ncbi:MAG TPA: zinc ribbon domain-containing protein [Gaiellaceae bacterium]|nr:zinc ribbon domain-containing protein [Gaiellaceae bacterium]